MTTRKVSVANALVAALSRDFDYLSRNPHKAPRAGLCEGCGAISGALAGGGIGLKAGMAKEVFAMEAGYAYHELKTMGVDDEPAKQIAIAVGAANAAIEFVQIGTLLKGLGKAVPTGYVSRMIARRLLAKGAAGRSAAALAAMAVDAAKETLQELGQESVAIAGTEFGAKMQGVNGLGKEQIAARLKDTALSSALGFLFLNIPGAVSGAHAANLPVLPGKYAAGTGGGEGELSTQNVTKGAGSKGVINSSSKSAALKSIDNLPSSVQPNVKRFFKGSSNLYSDFSVAYLENGNYMVRMTKSGNVPESKAVYYKEVDRNGKTIRVFKETYDPAGNLVHIKHK